MASTLTVQNTIDWVRPMLSFLPLNIGTNNEPAVTTARTVLQTIVGPPFAWPWNRVEKTFATVNGQRDTVVAMTDFGFLESASYTLAGQSQEVQIADRIGLGADSGAPLMVANLFDDNAGNYTFRIAPVPDAVYTITLTYQKKAPLITALTNLWAPVPDEFSYIYNYGFWSLSMAHADDQRFMVANQKFVAHLLGAAQGLDDHKRDMFLRSWAMLTGRTDNPQFRDSVKSGY